MNSLPASYEVADDETLKKQQALIESQDLLREAFEGVTDGVLVLNLHRQVVYANTPIKQYVPFKTPDEIVGLRPGNLLGCVHACEREHGCGTTAFCKYCGAAQVIQATLHEGSASENSSIKECRISRSDGSSLDLLVKGRRIHIEEQTFLLFSIRDISDHKRRRVLERVFFHDILNTVGGIRSLAELHLQEEEPSDYMKQLLFKLANDLISEIQAQQDLTAAEAGELTSNFISYPADAVLQQVVDRYRTHHLSQEKHIQCGKSSSGPMITTDERILKRVLGNMLRNALEACRSGETVRADLEPLEGAVRFRVHNERVISEDAQMQIFQRSFSTKGSRRGLGTYSIKLLTEKYLYGRVGFHSSEKEGTVFYVDIPEKIEGNQTAT